jgi:hypothetical protein
MNTTETKRALVTHQFTLVFAGRFDDLADDFLDALYEAGCDDALVGLRESVPVIDFARAAPSFRVALQSAIADVERAGLGLELIRVEPILDEESPSCSGLTKPLSST